ncbi:MAG: hypothetical protein KY446_04685 [Proteobacteria bacterium]|nr:hypothetical protein [Pseudomonadota bacterium]
MTRAGRLIGEALAGGLLLLALAGLAWLIVSGTLADRAVRESPGRALAWRSAHPDALQRLALERTQTESGADLRKAEALAYRALLASPLQVRAISALGLVADARGQEGRARTLMERAARRSLRDRAAHAWLFEHHLASLRPDRAWFHADMLLRSDPYIAEELAPLMSELSGLPGSGQGLAARLALRPYWREGILRELCRGADPDVLRSSFTSLQTTRAPPTSEELECWLRRLVDEGRYAEAAELWRGSLPRERRALLGWPNNGGFDPDEGPSPFAWTIPAAAAGEALIAPSGESRQGYALRVAPSGRVVGHWLEQLLLLPPGDYLLAFKTRAEQAGGTATMSWVVRCADSQTELGASGPLEGAAGWASVVVPFRVPGGGCPAQRLALEAAAAPPSAVESLAPVWFDDLRVSRRAGG